MRIMKWYGFVMMLKRSDSDKTKKAAEFVKKNIVKNVNYKKLSSDKLIKNTSNMLLVFDKYLQRK